MLSSGVFFIAACLRTSLLGSSICFPFRATRLLGDIEEIGGKRAEDQLPHLLANVDECMRLHTAEYRALREVG